MKIEWKIEFHLHSFAFFVAMSAVGGRYDVAMMHESASALVGNTVVVFIKRISSCHTESREKKHVKFRNDKFA